MDIRSRQPSLDAVTNFIGLEGELAEVKPLHCDRSVGHLALVDHPRAAWMARAISNWSTWSLTAAS